MRLKTVHIRFYRSFNLDYLLKNYPGAEESAKPWDMLDNNFYPYVRIPIHQKLTTIVGANESGKTHLLTAIEKGITGQGVQSADFCRYSNYFTVTKGEIRVPDFGFEWGNLSSNEKSSLREACGLTATTEFESFLIFRANASHLDVYLPSNGSFQHFEVKSDAVKTLLPKPFRINANIALPDSVPIKDLVGGERQGTGSKMCFLERFQRFGAYEGLIDLISHRDWFLTKETVAQQSQNLHTSLNAISSAVNNAGALGAIEKEMRAAQILLAKDLICKIARIDPEALRQLYDALKNGNDGHANGIIELINKNLASHLNFPKVWVQDREFTLRVSAREHDLVFTIRDRTNTEYSFSERSSGLKYFLSYYVQYLAHEPEGADTAILLMDEPDAYLSSQAQQDLLKIFRAFSEPEGNKKPVQVIYVTHSPFLIDKNNADRIRVLEKGSGEEGTRVVRNASQNHYEPLRSALGSFVGETTFIGNCNIMVEGTADQVLLGGASAYLRSIGRHEFETIDLNQTTVVPAGSASHIPYLVYLARGRDIEQPAVVVLLDNDSAGKNAFEDLKRGIRGKQVLKPEYVLKIDQLDPEAKILKTAFGGAPIEIEDLIPLPLCVEAAKAYGREYWNLGEDVVSSITADKFTAKKLDGKSVFDAITESLKDLPDHPHIDKIGFARAAIEIVQNHHINVKNTVIQSESVDQFEINMTLLLTKLKKMQRDAEKAQRADRVSQKTERLKRSFIQDHPDSATREEAALLLSEIETALDESAESDAARATAQMLRRDFHLTEDLFHPVSEWNEFKRGLERIKYAGLLSTQVDKSPKS